MTDDAGHVLVQWGDDGRVEVQARGADAVDALVGGQLKPLLKTARTQASAPDDRPDRPHPTDEGVWLEPFDGDTGAERDAERHTDYGVSEDW